MKKDKIFIDTGAWIALIDENDNYHDHAVSYYQHLNSSVQKFSSTYVISETYTWLRYQLGFSYASQFLSIIREACSMNTITLMKDEDALLEHAEQLLLDFHDQKLSYVDAVSMSMMNLSGITKVFGFDHHFYLMKFELLPM
ncbi:PIN domain-containing protein [Aquibacillus sp. 3ASR75-11]|uniref:PIN domain-containing protein n=1 Tax=Terrihalobacillus insolitus TaxID=2950438 RepID=A0A9X3WU41_9BACI|nr:PIN domain-containing protein [Terrihalobacillus insolitus]MDC3411965.1 PIN domain-containing protein [Terrihalobacillus insolitus]MDC3423349.1 PIN domain-containing protein [Terrihalobacillus insolitus]